MRSRITRRTSRIRTASTCRRELGDDLEKWVGVSNEADPEGMFLGEWHLRTLGFGVGGRFGLAEREVNRRKARDGGMLWAGRLQGSIFTAHPPITQATQATTVSSFVDDDRPESPSASSSGESFDLMHGAEAEKSVLYDGADDDDDGRPDNDEDGESTDRDDSRYHAHPQGKVTGTAVFDKM